MHFLYVDRACAVIWYRIFVYLQRQIHHIYGKPNRHTIELNQEATCAKIAQVQTEKVMSQNLLNKYVWLIETIYNAKLHSIQRNFEKPMLLLGTGF